MDPNNQEYNTNRKQFDHYSMKLLSLQSEREFLAKRAKEIDARISETKSIVSGLMEKLGVTFFPVGSCFVIMNPSTGPKIHRFCMSYNSDCNTEENDGFSEA